MTYTTIRIADQDAVRTITLHRPERRNAMTPQMQEELIDAFEETARSSMRALVLTGAEDAFCSGLDISALKEMNEKSVDEHRTSMERIAKLFMALYELPIPTIAAVHGPAVAGGAGIAMICDFTLATPEAKFGFTEVRIGFVPALVSAFLMLTIGGKHARDLLLTGRVLDADEAYRIGLINEIVQKPDLAKRTQALAENLISNSPQALALTKKLLITHNKAWLDEAIAEGLESSAQSRNSADFREGVAAFLEKRKPAWIK